MSKSKYIKLFDEALNSKMDLSKAFSVTWASTNGRNNIISAVLKGTNFEVFGAIMNSAIDADKLYKAALQRITYKFSLILSYFNVLYIIIPYKIKKGK